MARGKETCRILKEIRRQIAEANDIEFITSECRYKGDCLGTCPKCEAEVRYLEQQLRARRLAGKAIALAGISATAIALSIPSPAIAQIQPDNTPQVIDNQNTSAFTVKGTVRGYINKTKRITCPLYGATVSIPNTNKGTFTDVNGNFELSVCAGDSLDISYLGYISQTIQVSDATKSIKIILSENDQCITTGVVVTVKHFLYYLDLNIIDENGNSIDCEKIYIKQLFLNKDGETDSEDIYFDYIDDTGSYRICWNNDWGLKYEDDKTSNRATLRIEAEGYEEPVIIEVKRQKRHVKKTIRFEHKQ